MIGVIEAHANYDVMCYFLDDNRAISISYDKNKFGQFEYEKPS